MTISLAVPLRRYITFITNAQFAVITTSSTHTFSNGEIVSFRVSKPYGMVQINNKQARILTHTDNTITIDLDTMNFDPFIYPVSGMNTPPVVVPSCSGIIPGSEAATVNLEDCFDTIRSTL